MTEKLTDEEREHAKRGYLQDITKILRIHDALVSRVTELEETLERVRVATQHTSWKMVRAALGPASEATAEQDWKAERRLFCDSAHRESIKLTAANARIAELVSEVHQVWGDKVRAENQLAAANARAEAAERSSAFAGGVADRLRAEQAVRALTASRAETERLRIACDIGADLRQQLWDRLGAATELLERGRYPFESGNVYDKWEEDVGAFLAAQPERNQDVNNKPRTSDDYPQFEAPVFIDEQGGKHSSKESAQSAPAQTVRQKLDAAERDITAERPEPSTLERIAHTLAGSNQAEYLVEEIRKLIAEARIRGEL